MYDLKVDNIGKGHSFNIVFFSLLSQITFHDRRFETMFISKIITETI